MRTSTSKLRESKSAKLLENFRDNIFQELEQHRSINMDELGLTCMIKLALSLYHGKKQTLLYENKKLDVWGETIEITLMFWTDLFYNI